MNTKKKAKKVLRKRKIRGSTLFDVVKELNQRNASLQEVPDFGHRVTSRSDLPWVRWRSNAESGVVQLDPIEMLLWCPSCHHRHIDIGEFAYKPHRTHACQNCGMVWQPALIHTVGVQFLSGFKNNLQYKGIPIIMESDLKVTESVVR